MNQSTDLAQFRADLGPGDPASDAHNILQSQLCDFGIGLIAHRPVARDDKLCVWVGRMHFGKGFQQDQMAFFRAQPSDA